ASSRHDLDWSEHCRGLCPQHSTAVSSSSPDRLGVCRRGRVFDGSDRRAPVPAKVHDCRDRGTAGTLYGCSPWTHPDDSPLHILTSRRLRVYYSRLSFVALGESWQ